MRVKTPSGWEPTTFGSVAEYINGFAFKPEDWKKHGTPIIRIMQMTDLNTDCDHYPGPLPDKYRIDDGDLLFSWSATLLALIWDRGPAYINQHIFKVVPNDKTDRRFLHHILNFKMNELTRQTHGTTMKHIKRSDLLPFPISLPPLPEQRSIAEILNTLDEAICKTEQVISKLQQMKQGLLNDLLTRGIDENGELRDTERHPEQFKETPLGILPCEWVVWSIREICHLGRGRVISQDYLRKHPGPYPVYSSQSKDEGVFGHIANYDFEGPHVTWTTDGAYAGTVFYREGRFNCTNVCGTLCASVADLDMSYLAMALAPATSRHVSRLGNDKLMNNIMAEIRIPVPPLREQRAIADLMRTFDERLAREELELKKLTALKHGLKDDLLTGRVRVCVRDKDAT